MDVTDQGRVVLGWLQLYGAVEYLAVMEGLETVITTNDVNHLNKHKKHLGNKKEFMRILVKLRQSIKLK